LKNGPQYAPFKARFGQLGYFRALADFFRTRRGRVEALTEQTPQVSFESPLKKQAQAIVAVLPKIRAAQ